MALSAAALAQTTVTAYDCWSNLGFNGTPVNISSWSGNGTAVTFINDSAQAHTGTGALKIDGTSPISVWGGTVTATGPSIPAAGDSVGGSFWIKILSTPTSTSMVDVRMTGYDSSNAETVYCNSASINPATLPVNVWTKIDLVPSSAKIAAGMTIGFNIVSSGGVNCLIDDVVFGKSTTSTPSTGGTYASQGSMPYFQEYVGSTFNGNFEVGNASIGLQYWGQYVPNQPSGTTFLNLITNPSGTAPGATINGANMVSVVRGGGAWNLVPWSSDASDKLAREGDLVGGYYWLYVPATADLTSYPKVSFICQTSGGDVTISDTTIATASLVKGMWNKIPVYPIASASNTVTPPLGRNVGIIINAPQVNSTNPLYAAPYYIDNIRVGKIPAGIYVSPSTTLTDSTGAAISDVGTSDTSLYADVVVQNSLNASATGATVVLKLYERGVLKSTAMKPFTINAKGASSVSQSLVSISAPLNGLDKTKLSAKVFIYDSTRQTLLAPSYTLIQKATRIAPNDPNIKYIGRWTGNSSSYVSDYIRPYFKTTFTGTSVSINLQASTNLTVTVDGVETSYNGAVGMVNLASNLSPLGTHTLSVASLTYPDIIRYEGLYLDDSGTLTAPVVVPNEIEFIGDSITAWEGGYSWRVPKALGVEGSRIAWPGIALVDGFGYYQVPPPPLVGMQSAYFKIGMPGKGSGTAGDWNFATAPYTPRVVVINLGTNDGAAITGKQDLLANFKNAYKGLIQGVRAKFPSAEIFVLRAFSIHYADVNTAVQGAATDVINGGDSKVHYVDTSSWGVEIGSDTIHPTDAGHVTITNKLVPILAPYLQSVAPSFMSANSATFTKGETSDFKVIANGYPAATFSATGLPAGLSLNATTGVLSGAPTQSGSFSFTITATNGTAPNATQNFTVTVPASSGGGSGSQTFPVTVSPGTGTGRVSSVISVPVTAPTTGSGQMTGLVTGVTANTITNSNAGWTAGQLSAPATPSQIRFTSGPAVGMSFLLSTTTANTATTVTLDASETTSLVTLGVAAGQAYEIFPCPTLLSLLGTPGTTGVQGGTSAANADQVQVLTGGIWKNYYYNTTNSSWRSVGTEVASNNVPVPKSAAIIYSRLSGTPLNLSFTGSGPDTQRVVSIANSGTTFVSSGWTTDIALADCGLNKIPGWATSANPANADTVSLLVGTTWKKYYFDGTNWRLAGLNTVSNTVPIRAGSGMLISRVGTASGSTTFIQNLP